MWIIRFLKNGNLNRVNFLICFVLVALFHLTLNIIIDNNEFLWTIKLTYYINIIISSVLLLTLLSARLRYIKIKSPITVSSIITLAISLTYVLSLSIFREWMIAGLIIYSISLVMIGITFVVLLFK